MKIAIVRSGILSGGGISRVIESWARMLGGAGHDVTVVSQSSPKARELPAMDGVRAELSTIPAEAGRRSRLFLEAASVVSILERLHRAGELDIVLSHNSLLSSRIRRSFPSIRIVQTFHSPIVDEHHLDSWKYAPSPLRRLTYPATHAMLWNAERQALRSITCAHTLGEYTWGLISRRYPRLCRDLPWSKIPGTFDADQFVPPRDRVAVRRDLGLPTDETILLTVRRLVPRNGVDRILEAASALRSRHGRVRFLIGGTGELQKELESGVREGGLGEVFEMLGFIP